MEITQAMVLAAGQGSRLRPLTDHMPKPMLSVGGKPLMEHTILQLAENHVQEVGFNLHHCPEVVRDYFGDGSRYGMRFQYSYEPQLLGTAGGVKKLESMFGEAPFYIIYGDNLTSCDLGSLARLHQARGGIATVALFWKEDVTPHSAVEITDDDQIIRFLEKPKAEEAPSHWISAGVMVLEPAALKYVPQGVSYDFGFDLFPRLLSQGERIFGYRMSSAEGLWWIDTPEQYEFMCGLWKNGCPGSSAS
jgi:NDP-sugar pyrophosphorylase family protein